MTAEAPTPIDDCWNRIGVHGDRSCLELQSHVHCRNCPVHAASARAFFDRPAPRGYLAEWTRTLAAPLVTEEESYQSLLIFRLADEWIALRTRIVVEVTRPRPVHRIPHRSNESLLGLVSLRGQLQLIVALDRLLSITAPGASLPSLDEPGRRFVVIKDHAETWVFPAWEVAGVQRFARDELDAIPSTLANPLSSFSQAVIRWRDQSVGFLDDHRLFAALRGIST